MAIQTNLRGNDKSAIQGDAVHKYKLDTSLSTSVNSYELTL